MTLTEIYAANLERAIYGYRDEVDRLRTLNRELLKALVLKQGSPQPLARRLVRLIFSVVSWREYRQCAR